MRRAYACSAALVASLAVSAGQAEFFDDFASGTLDAAWEWYVPAGGPTYALGGSEFTLDVPSGDYDAWSSFDRAPRLRTANLATDTDFRIETHVAVDVPTGPTYYQTGLWVGFSGAGGNLLDGWFYGFYSAPGWVGTHTIRTERVGLLSPAWGLNFPVPWGFAETDLKIERIGDTYSFFYRESGADAWIKFHSASSPGAQVIDVGVFAKNWAGANAAIRARFDYFRIADPENVLPVFDPITDDVACTGLAYCKTLVPRQAFPSPTWSLATDPAPATAAAIDANGRVTWAPGAADSGKTFTFTATATNTAGSVPVSWKVVAKDTLRDEFDGPDLAPGFAFYTPQTGPTLTLDLGLARLQFGVTGDQGLNFDAWSGFDRMPRIQASLGACADFVVETVLTVVDPAAGVVVPIHGGVWVGFAGGGIDGLVWGPINGATTLRLERMGINMPQTDVATTGSPELGLRVQRRGDEFTFSYRDGPDAAWVEHWKQSFAGVEINYVGVCAKNYGGGAPVIFDIDYLHAGPPAVEGPKLEDSCPDAIMTTTVGGMFTKRIAYQAGTPLPTEIVVDGPGAFDAARGIYTVAPSAVGEFNVTITATMAGTIPATVSFRVKAFERTAHFEDFEVDVPEDLVSPWELYNPSMIDPSPFTIAGDVGARALELHMASGIAYDHWSGVDNAPQARVSALSVPDLAGDFTIEAKLTLREYNTGEPFHTGITVGFGMYELYYWGFYNGTNLVLERSGVNGLQAVANTAETVTLRVRRECDTFYFLMKPEGGEWQLASVQTQPAAWAVPPEFVGLILKTYGAASVTIDCEYFDIFAGAPGPVEPQFRRGDVNQDGSVNIADPISLLGYLFASKPAPACRDAADANDDGALNIADAIKVLSHLFGGTGPLPEPASACGPDVIADTLPACEFDQAGCP